jgi:hypothetical protein
MTLLSFFDWNKLAGARHPSHVQRPEAKVKETGETGKKPGGKSAPSRVEPAPPRRVGCKGPRAALHGLRMHLKKSREAPGAN